jgi:uncharacterized protein (TIGR02145 family)
VKTSNRLGVTIKKKGVTYGKLYNWFAVKDLNEISPDGWHVPSEKEWEIMHKQLGGWDVAGKKMKSSSGWFKYGNGTNSSGFEGLPGGSRYGNGKFDRAGIIGAWWTSTEKMKNEVPVYIEEGAFTNILYYNASTISASAHFSVQGLSVRCIKD